MSEDEAIKRLQEILDFKKNTIDKIEDPIEREIEENCYIEEMPFKAIETILDLYKQEKEKNIEIDLQYVTKLNNANEKNKELEDVIELMAEQLAPLETPTGGVAWTSIGVKDVFFEIARTRKRIIKE